jgi:hypothetical protein
VLTRRPYLKGRKNGFYFNCFLLGIYLKTELGENCHRLKVRAPKIFHSFHEMERRRRGRNESLLVNEKFPALSLDNNPSRIIVVAPRIIITTTLIPSPFSLSNFFGAGVGVAGLKGFISIMHALHLI